MPCLYRGAKQNPQGDQKLVQPGTSYNSSSFFSQQRHCLIAGLARGRSYVSLKVSQVLKFCTVTGTHLVDNSAMSLGNLSIGTQGGSNSRQRGLEELQNIQRQRRKETSFYFKKGIWGGRKRNPRAYETVSWNNKVIF